MHFFTLWALRIKSFYSFLTLFFLLKYIAACNFFFWYYSKRSTGNRVWQRTVRGLRNVARLCVNVALYKFYIISTRCVMWVMSRVAPHISLSGVSSQLLYRNEFSHLAPVRHFTIFATLSVTRCADLIIFALHSLLRAIDFLIRAWFTTRSTRNISAAIYNHLHASELFNFHENSSKKKKKERVATSYIK